MNLLLALALLAQPPAPQIDARLSVDATGGTFTFRLRASLVSGGPRPPAPMPAPTPTPTPTPAPAPPPAVAPVTGDLYATLFHRLGDRSAVPLQNGQLFAALAPLNCRWAAFEDSARRNDPATLRPRETTILQDLGLENRVVAAGGVPVVFIQAATGEVLEAVATPTPAAVVAAVRRLRGLNP